ncbi:beta-ketoacyl synthase N-terminal-like domain-containing protein [Aliikangiella coralliicola]|uniref:Beta-ketoacyl synthase-like N-terminal domain-containing protein n=1 Tax=Aliikangiella coralliicola TaxID=2592383 RepID=A0A545U8U1_9GAMM|nr:beta-ketoacyl synthase N-terminal-like domain-containing protein [Aliikangiella coralliicola]TQV85884.1 hypothetical protein FLL46_18345 [Aliikangiella coralliicola]
MKNKTQIFILGAGMITPVGIDSNMTIASIQAGISKIEVTAEHDCYAEPFKLATVPEDALPPLNDKLNAQGLTSRYRRLLRLASPALIEVMQSYSEDEPLPLFLAGPETLPGRASVLQRSFIERLSIQTGVKFNQQLSRIFSTGRAGGFQAIDMVFRYFEATGADYALVGGLDTHLDLHLLGTLDRESRILTDDRKDGFIPGEAAGFLLLVSENARQRMGNVSLPELFMPGFGNESGHRYSEQPYTGDGLSEAVRLAVLSAKGRRVSTIFSSLNGEHFGAKEYGVAITRNSDTISENINLEHPADCFGDIGAAFVPVLSSLAIHQHINSKHNQSSLLYCSSEGALRGAMLIA